MKTKNQFSLSSKYLLLILAIVCIVLMGLSGFAERTGNPLSWIAGYAGIIQNGSEYSRLSEVRSECTRK